MDSNMSSFPPKYYYCNENDFWFSYGYERDVVDLPVLMARTGSTYSSLLFIVFGFAAALLIYKFKPVININ